MPSYRILLPNHLPRAFSYLAPEGVALAPGDYVRAPFAGRELPGVVWKEEAGEAEQKLKTILAHYAHLPPMQEAMRRFLDWAAWYTLAPVGAVLKMALPIAEALEPPGKRERANLPEGDIHAPETALSARQREAAEQLRAKNGQGFSVTLLDGVTGSGKTEVYFDALAHAIAGHGQALVLLPEISLSVQWLERFERRFGAKPLVWHSGLTPARRKHTWRAVVSGEAKVVVGARSALFLPFRSLKTIVVDEEHDASYKQEDGVTYHARDMAVARARFENIPVTLVSATPSLETLWNVEQGKYHSIALRERHAGAGFPDTELIDMREEALERGQFIGPSLRRALAENLASGNQSLLFLNRRGYAPLLLCRACGHRFQCPSCTAWLVMHRAVPKLQCHHCGHITPIPSHCPECAAEGSFHPCGPGVERVAEEVKAFLPEAGLTVMTSDAIESYAQLQDKIREMEEGRTQVMVGTQMVAKGHHFPNLTLVGVVDADLGLMGGDLRAGERTYQLLHQLAGRAGREKAKPGRVLVQSFLPGHPAMQALASGDRDAFMALEMQARKASGMPPFSRLAAVIIEGENEEQVIAYARDLALLAPRVQGLEILGPAPAPLYRLRDLFRYRLLARGARELNMQTLLTGWIATRKHPNALRIKVDIDPYSFL